MIFAISVYENYVHVCNFEVPGQYWFHHPHVGFQSKSPNGQPTRPIVSCLLDSISWARAISSSTSQLDHRYFPFKNRASSLASQTINVAGRDTKSKSAYTVSLILRHVTKLPSSEWPTLSAPPASLFMSVMTTPGWMWKTRSVGLALATESHSRKTPNLAIA